MTNTVTIGVASREEINARFMRAMTTGKRTAPFIGFADERATAIEEPTSTFHQGQPHCRTESPDVRLQSSL